MKRAILLITIFFSYIVTYTQEINNLGISKGEQSAYFNFSESQKKEKYKIAVLTPLYLDSVDLAKNLNHIPKFMMPGIDFYQGIRIAADTLNKEGAKLDLYIYDSKSNYFNVEKILKSDRLDSMDLIIGNASVSDIALLADFAKKNQINFVSAISPSDANQTKNPYFTILQPRLLTHIERIHSYISRRAISDNVVFITDGTNSSNNALQYFKNSEINAMPKKFIEFKISNDDFNISTLNSKIDSNYNTTIILGLLDAGLTYKILKKLNEFTKKYDGVKIFCMPTAEAITSLGKADEFPNSKIFYTTSYVIDKVTPASMYIGREYKKYMGSAPSDVVYKGFESLWFFVKLMEKYGVPFNNYINDNSYSFITPYKIMPVKNKSGFYFFENKFLYLVKYENGIVTYE